MSVAGVREGYELHMTKFWGHRKTGLKPLLSPHPQNSGYVEPDKALVTSCRTLYTGLPSVFPKTRSLNHTAPGRHSPIDTFSGPMTDHSALQGLR